MTKKNLNRPGFFIVGAPKCGTTSLAFWLAKHPQIFLSNPKEIYYFDTDQKTGIINSEDEYLKIFKNANQAHLAIGEASVTYLKSSIAAKNILSFNPDAKFIVMVRNPMEMAPSLHLELLWDGWECIDDFEKAWHSRDKREIGAGKSGQFCTEISFLNYEKMCKLGEQVQRILNVVDARSIIFIVMDDLSTNPLQEYMRTLEFLGVPYDGRTNFPSENTRKIARNNILRNLTIKLFHLKAALGLRKQSFGLLNSIDKINNCRTVLPALRPELRTELAYAFKDDVSLLSELLSRDFSHWLR